MKKNLLRAISALILCALVGGSVLANVKTKKVRFNENVTIGGTLVKKGEYKVSFDDQTNELSIINGKQVVAKTTARLEADKLKSQLFSTPAYKTKQDGSATRLTSVYVGGAYAVLGEAGTTDTTTAQ